MNPEQAPWPINKLQEAKRNRDNLAKYSDEQIQGRTEPSLEIPEDRRESEATTASNTKGSSHEYSEVSGQGDKLSPSFTDDNFDNQTEVYTHDEPKIPSLDDDPENGHDSSRLFKAVLVVVGIAALIIAGLLAYEHPMPRDEFQPEVSHTQDPLKVDDSEATEVTTVTNESIDATPANEKTEKTHTAGSLIEESKLDQTGNPTTSQLTHSNEKPAHSNELERSETQELANSSISNDVPSDTQAETQLIESQYESIDSPQLEIAASPALVDNEEDASNRTANTAEVKILLNRAESLYNDLQLTIPPGDNALDIYQHVLEIDSDNTDAIKGIEQIKEKLLDLSELAMAEQDWLRARQHLDKIVSIEPDNSRALELLESLNTE
jgi:uncharacterized protein YxeA